MTMNFQDLFLLGMKRQLPELLVCDGLALDIGASGKYVAPHAIPIGAPKWLFPEDQIPATDNSVATIHCYHFLEHLTGEHAVMFLREVERVLQPYPKGVMNFSVPYYSSSLAVQNLDHKSFWCEDSFKCLFTDKTYDNFGDWRLRVHFLLVAGIVQRNMCIIGQLVREPKP
jgi:hypothetical protein